MRINSKGFILIETLAVTVFAASIFVFLFKSVAPLMGYYNTRMEQMGNIDSVFNNYTLRKFIYRDEYFNNPSAQNFNSSNKFAIKDLDYTWIVCHNTTRDGFSGSNRKLVSTIYSKDYCNSLMEQMGAREHIKDDKGEGYINHYLIFYINASKLDDFMTTGIQAYKRAKIKIGYRTDMAGTVVSDGKFGSSVFDDKDTVDLFKSALKEVKEPAGTTPDSSKGFLLFYYLYPNPMYDGTADEPAYKESINVLPMKPSNNNINCFKTQIIPGYKYFYKYYYKDINRPAYSDSDRKNNKLYYFFHDRNSATNDQFYTIYRISDINKPDYKYKAGMTKTRCMNYFKDKVVKIEGSERKMSNSELWNFCYLNKFNNLDLQSDWANFEHARFAEKAFNFNYNGSDTTLPTPEVAIIGYDSSCSKDVIIPTTIYGYNVTVIGYEAFKNTGIRTIKLNNIKVIDKNALNLFSESAINNFKSQIPKSTWSCIGGDIETGCFNGILIKNG
jgi:hypothetical protein